MCLVIPNTGRNSDIYIGPGWESMLRNKKAITLAMLASAVIALPDFLPDAVGQTHLPLGLPAVAVPADNKQTPEKIALGKKLFHDARFSADGKISCASCHPADRGFMDGRKVAQGLNGKGGTRNTPTLLNVSYLTSLFWDGRRPTLEEQAPDPFVNPIEHGIENYDVMIKVIRSDRKYVPAFTSAFNIKPNKISLTHIAKALASFERSLVSGDSRFDRYFYGGDKPALSGSEINGLDLFRGRARCATCHVIGAQSALFTDNDFHSLGVGFELISPKLATLTKRIVNLSVQEVSNLIAQDADVAALGRFSSTRKPNDIGRFRTPSLRNVAKTAPYMHDGSVETLEEAVELEVYYRSLEANRPLLLTPQERADIVAFLKSLTSAHDFLGPPK